MIKETLIIIHSIRKHFRIGFLFLLLLSAVLSSGLSAQIPPSNSTDIIRLQNFLQGARRSEEYGDHRSAFNYYKRIMDIDWQYEKTVGNFVQSGIKSGAVKETETQLLKIFALYKDSKISSAADPVTALVSALAVFYISTDRAQTGEEYINMITRSGLPAADKAKTTAEIYRRSSRSDAAISTLEEARKNLKEQELFSWQLYQLYQDRKEYLSAGLELNRYINSISRKSAVIADTEADLQTAEAEMTKLVESASAEELNKIIADLQKRSSANSYFFKILSAVFFNQKKYTEAFEYFQKSPALQNIGSSEYLTFARELNSENETAFAIEYYAIFFAKAENIPLNLPDFFNYLRLLVHNGRVQEALTILEAPTLPSIANPVLLDLFKADIYLYDIKQPSVAEKIIAKYLDGNDVPSLMAHKISRDLAVWQQDFKKAAEINSRLENSVHIRSNPTARQEVIFTAMLLQFLNHGSDNFKDKAVQAVKRHSGADSDNDLLMLLEDLKLIENQPESNRIYRHYLAFTIHKQPDTVMDSLKSAAPDKIEPACFQRAIYYYLKTIDRKAASIFINRLTAAQIRSDYLPEIILDQAKSAVHQAKSSAETESNLLYLIKNYPKSPFEEPARKLLRKIMSKRAG